MENLMAKPLYKMTGADVIELSKVIRLSEAKEAADSPPEKQYVYGISGIAELLNCSISTATRYKASGVLDLAIKQTGHTIVAEAGLTLELIKKVKRNRRKH